jgi:hypothetical protein
MSDHYHDPADVRLLKEMRTLSPADYEAWRGLNSIIARTDGAIPRKYRELIAIAVGVTTQLSLLHRGACERRKGRGRDARRDRRSVARRRRDPRRQRHHARHDGLEVFRSDAVVVRRGRL